jgi:PilZ domain
VAASALGDASFLARTPGPQIPGVTADNPRVSEIADPTHGPQPGEVVALYRQNAFCTTAVVEQADNGGYTLRLEHQVALASDIDVRWFDGDCAWHANAELEAGATPGLLEAVPRADWEPVRGRESERIPVGRHSVRVRVVASQTIATSRELDVVCLDFSATGCRVSWPGQAPGRGDALRLALGDLEWAEGREPDWLDVKVVRVDKLPFAGNHVGLAFELETDADRRVVRGWRDHWAQQQRVHLQPPGRVA